MEEKSPSLSPINHITATLMGGLDKEGFTYLGSGLFFASTASIFDHKVDRWFQNHKLISDDLEKFGYEVGKDGRMLMGSLIHVFFNRSYGVAHLESYLATGITVEAVKNTTRRSRPNNNGYKSMPSGHVGVVTTSATSLSYSYGKWVAIPVFTVALLTFISRLQSRGHWLSDNIVGATIGMFWARSAALHHNRILPIIGGDKVGIMVHRDY